MADLSSATLHVRMVADVAGNEHVLIEEWMRLHVRPKPRRMPEALYRRLLARLLYLERFKEAPDAHQD